MKTFRSKTLQDASEVPWFADAPVQGRPVWGVNIVPWPVYASYETDETGFQQGVGEPLYYEWQSELPEGTELPDWIEEVLPPVVDPVEEQPTV